MQRRGQTADVRPVASRQQGEHPNGGMLSSMEGTRHIHIVNPKVGKEMRVDMVVHGLGVELGGRRLQLHHINNLSGGGLTLVFFHLAYHRHIGNPHSDGGRTRTEAALFKNALHMDLGVGL